MFGTVFLPFVLLFFRLLKYLGNIGFFNSLNSVLSTVLVFKGRQARVGIQFNIDGHDHLIR